MIPQQFSSNENKKLIAVRECSLFIFGTNFVILNTATQHNANTFQSNHFARLILVDGTIKWRIMLNLCISHCIGALFLKSSFHTCTPDMRVYIE